MKIGTITFYKIEDNYGCILQCFALVKYLNNKGHDAFFIKNKLVRRKTLHSRFANFFKLAKTIVTNPIKAYTDSKKAHTIKDNKERRRLEAIKHPRNFNTFFTNHIPSTEKVYNQFDIMASPPLADAYICGSDQIWGGDNPTMYLRFAPKGKKKIAFAASFGGLEPKPDVLEKIKLYISDFDYVSLRENSGVELCKNKLGRKDAQLSLDPTLLLSAQDYRLLETPDGHAQNSDKPYVFIYLLGNTMTVNVETIINFLNEKGLEYKYVASGGRVDNFPKLYPTVEEWISLIDHAEYIITNSYHGTIFSLIFKKKFLTIPLAEEYERMNVRINDMLTLFSLQNRIYSSTFNTLFEDIIYDTFESNLKIMNEKTNNMLGLLLQ